MTEVLPGVARLRDTVDAVLVPEGFAAAQGSFDVRGSGGAGGWVWCAERTAFTGSFPALLPDGGGGGDGAPQDVCVDVVVEVSGHRGAWRTTSVRLEGRELREVLGDLGDEEAAAAARVLAGLDVADGALVPELLRRVLDLGRAAQPDGPPSDGGGSVRGQR